MPFKLAGPKVLTAGTAARDPAARPVINVVILDVGNRVRCGDKIPCEITLSVREEREMPGSVLLELVQNDRIFDSCRTVPQRNLGSGVFTLRGGLKAPRKPGRYQVRGKAVDTEIMPASPGREAEIVNFTTKSDAVILEVIP